MANASVITQKSIMANASVITQKYNKIMRFPIFTRHQDRTSLISMNISPIPPKKLLHPLCNVEELSAPLGV